MQEREYRLFRKGIPFLIPFFLMIFLPPFLLAQAPIPSQKLPRTVQSPNKAIPVSKQQAQSVIYQAVRVEAVQLWPAKDCGGTWQARISNPQDVAIGKSYAIAYQKGPGPADWVEGPAVEFSLEKNQEVTVRAEWRQLTYTKEFKVAFRPSGSKQTYHEKIIPLPGGAPSLVIEGIEIGGDGVVAYIRNTSSMAGCGRYMQMYKAKNSNPGTFSVAANSTVHLPAGSTTACKFRTDTESLKREWDLGKIVVFGDNNVILAEQVFPIQ